MFVAQIRRSGKNDVAEVEFRGADVNSSSEFIEDRQHFAFDPDMQLVLAGRNIAQFDLTV